MMECSSYLVIPPSGSQVTEPYVIRAMKDSQQLGQVFQNKAIREKSHLKGHQLLY